MKTANRRMIKAPKVRPFNAYVGGVFDLFHVGHLNILRKTKRLGCYVVAAVSTDELVEKYKGKKPIIPFEQRVAILKGCKYVDKVITQTKIISISLLKKHKIDIIVLGSDWKGVCLPALYWIRRNREGVKYFPYTKKVSATIIKNNCYWA